MAGPAEEAAAAAAAAFWVNQTAQQVANITETAGQQAVAVWNGFVDWTTADAIAERAAQAAQVSADAQDIVTQLMAQYVAEITAAISGTRGVTVPRIATPQIRNGADPVLVHSRTAKAYRLDYANTQDAVAATAAAYQRELDLIQDDLMLTARQAQDDSLYELGVTRYRRVLRPELSATGSCGLCLAASLQVYTVGDLMPIHTHCKCLTMPIIDGKDPAEQLNEEDRRAAYAEAGATGKSDLSNVRVQVHEHGELGPVLTVKGQKFTGPKDLADKGSGKPPADGSRPKAGFPEDDGSRILPVDQAVVFSGQAIRDPSLNPVLTYSDLDDRSLIAPENEPAQYFTPEESAIADWLAERGLTGIRSVRDLKTKPRTPDSVIDQYFVTCEFKSLLESGTDAAIKQAIRSAKGQSRRIVIDGRPQNLQAGVAVAGIRRALGQYIEDLDEVVIILGDGTSVGWWHGRR